MTPQIGGSLPSGAVTFLLTDVEGSTRLWESDPVVAAAAMARHRELLDEVIAACRGARPVEQGEGDSTVSGFSRPSDAVRAAIAAQRALVAEPWDEGMAVRVRMALHTGEVVVNDDGTYAGGTLNRCARLRSLAHGGQVLVSSTTRDLVVDHLEPGNELIDLGSHRLRDLSRPEHVWQLQAAGLRRDHPPLRSLDAVPNNLPVQLSSFVGRDEDIARGVTLLCETRLLTLTGAGGCGKTRLAQRIAADVVDRYPAGVWWVELASLTDGALIGDSVAAVLGEKVPAERTAIDVLASALGRSPALLVLDNCEHLVTDAASFVDRLLRAAPAVALVATSRETLGVEGEVTWRVPSLAVPPSEADLPDALEQYDAVRLFIERALQARPNFRVTNDNAPAVAQICHRLDGIPLAIELAAARTRVLPPERIADELDDRFRLLTGHNRVGVPRQQTLLASVDWSHDLLEPAERALLRRLGVFAGTFTLDAAEVVGATQPLADYEVLDVLTRLVDKSLVQFDEVVAGPGRYRLLETIRQYALARLADAGEVAAVRGRHLAWALRLACDLEPEATNAHPRALDQLDSERANLHAALEWAASSGELAVAWRLMSAVGLWWAQRGHYSEAGVWEARLLDEAEPGDGSPARARWACSYVRWYAGDFVGSLEQASRALREAGAAGDDSTAARCLHTINTAMLGVDPAVARQGLLEAAELARKTGDDWCLCDALQIVAYTHLLELDHRAAGPILEEAFAICDRLDNDFQRAWHHAALAWAAMLRAEFAEADATIRQAMSEARLVGDPGLQLRVCAFMGLIALERGEPAGLASELAALRAERREWGSFGEALLAAFEAMTRVAEDPGGACEHLEAIGAGFLEAGDALDASLVLFIAARAAFEAGRPHDVTRLAGRAASALPGGWRAQALLYGGAAGQLLDKAEAGDKIHDGLAELVSHEVLIGIPLALETLGRLAVDGGELIEGVRLLGAADAMRRRTGQRRLPAEQARFDADLAAVAALLAGEFDQAWEEGTRLPTDEAVAYARRARGARRRPTAGWDSLTPTEHQVVELAAQGLTNPEIGERLFIGRGTVKTHLAHIFAKLNVSTRAELAATASRRLAGEG